MAIDSSNPLGYFFPQLFGRTPAPTSYEALAARRKIAEAMMARQTKMPQNVGQGLTAIGDAIGDRGYYNNVLADEEASKGYEATRTAALPPPSSTYRPYSPAGDDSDSIAPATKPPMPPPVPVTPQVPRSIAPQANVTPQQNVPVPSDSGPAPGGTPLPPDQIQDPDSTIIRMPSPQAVQDWRNSVQIPTFPQPKPQPGPRSDAAPSPTGAANIPPLASAYQQPPGVQTAALSPTGTVSDAPDPAASAVRDNIAKAQVAQNTPNVFPPVASDASKAVIPGGFQPPGAPQPAAPQIRAAPPQPQIQKAPPGVPEVSPLGPKPASPQLMPTENERTQHFESIAADPRLSPQARQQASTLAATERAQINAFNAQKIQEYNLYLQRWLDAKGKREDPSTQLDVYKKQMELTPDQINDLTPQEKAVLGDLPPGVRVYKDALGHLQKIVGPQSVTVDQRGENEEAKVSGQLAAKRADATIQAGEAADETKFNIARARAMLDQIKTGAFQDGKTSIAAIGRGLGVSDDFLIGIGLDPKGIGTKQAFQAVVNELAMGKIGAGGMPSNNFSEGDRKFLEKTVISLGDDDEANRIKLAAADLVADRKREKATAWGDWQDNPENKGGYAAFERKWNKDMRARNDSTQLQKDADAWLAKARGQLPSPAAEFSSQEKADAIKWIGDNPNSPKIPAIKQRYGLP